MSLGYLGSKTDNLTKSFFNTFSDHQLGQGVLVQLSPSLIKRQKTHFHNLPCGASIILGNNGFVWLYPTPEQQEEEAGGFYTSLEVGNIKSCTSFCSYLLTKLNYRF